MRLEKLASKTEPSTRTLRRMPRDCRSLLGAILSNLRLFLALSWTSSLSFFLFVFLALSLSLPPRNEPAGAADERERLSRTPHPVSLGLLEFRLPVVA